MLDMKMIHGQMRVADASFITKGNEAYKELCKKMNPLNSLGWVYPNAWVSRPALERIASVAKRIRDTSEVLVVIGIGGSNQGARAVIDALGNKSSCEIVWAGNTLSSFEYEKILQHIQGKTFSIDVIAKNFETLEPGVAFRIFRKILEDKYGDNAKDYIYVTGTIGSYFNELATKEGYTFLTFPTDIGGRYSIFSDVGLLPISVAGLDAEKLVEGFETQAKEFQQNHVNLVNYAATRNVLFAKGYRVEMESFFEPRLFRFAKWWTQLMAESEGKDGKGIYPIIGSYSEDLHSVGQFIQDGSPIIFEHFIKVHAKDSEISLKDDNVADRFSYLDSLSLWNVNKTSQDATIEAHAGRLPVFVMEIERIDELNLGRMFYYFMVLCAVSGKIGGINPFDQPGVEAYKMLMFHNLKRGW